MWSNDDDEVDTAQKTSSAGCRAALIEGYTVRVVTPAAIESRTKIEASSRSPVMMMKGSSQDWKAREHIDIRCNPSGDRNPRLRAANKYFRITSYSARATT
jgi:hypothetical protein